MATRAIAWIALLAAAPAAHSAEPGAGTASEIERTIEMSPQERIEYAESAIEELEGYEALLDDMLAKARGSNDDAAIEFLVPRVTAMKALNRVAKAAYPKLTDAVEDENPDMIEHEFRKIAVAISRARQLLAEAQRQGADQELESGNTSLEWQDQFVSDAAQDGGMGESPPDFSLDLPQNSAFE